MSSQRLLLIVQTLAISGAVYCAQLGDDGGWIILLLSAALVIACLLSLRPPAPSALIPDKSPLDDHPDTIITTTASGKILTANKAARHLLQNDMSPGSDITAIFRAFHENSFNPLAADQVVDALLASPDMRFTDTLTKDGGITFERMSRPTATTEGRLWVIRDVTHLLNASEDQTHTSQIIEEDAARMTEMAEQLYIAKSELEAKQQELTYLANTDSLTGLCNRRHFMERGQKIIADEPHNAVALMLDIDHFKKVNDTYGHASGDQVIREFGRLIQNCVGEKGEAGRMGGEEFAVFLPGQNIDDAVKIAERIRQQTEEKVIIADNGSISFTCSIGIAKLAPDDHDLEHTLNRADIALYEAKQSGRNKVVVYNDAPDSSGP